MSPDNIPFHVPAHSTFTAISKPQAPRVKAVNVFSNDGSFLDRIKREMKEGDDKKKQEALERKKNFGDRFKNRGKRPPPPTDSADTTPEIEEFPHKKIKITPETDDAKKQKNEKSAAQAKYHNAIGSYPTSLKDSGTGVRSLAK